MVESKVSKLALPRFIETFSERHTERRSLRTFRTSNLICPNVSTVLEILGSLTKFLPRSLPGGHSPVNAYFIHSMIVVFPHPFSPNIKVTGEVNRTIYKYSENTTIINKLIYVITNIYNK